MNKLLLTKLILNGGPGSGNFNPGQGRGIGKPGNGRISHNTVWHHNDNVSLEKDGNKIEGSLRIQESADGRKFFIDTEDGNSVEITKSELFQSKVTKTASQKRKEQAIKELESQGIVHKSAKERQTEKQKSLIKDISSKMKIDDKLQKWLYTNADEEFLGHLSKGLDEAKNLGLDTSNISLEKLRTGSKVYGTSSVTYSGKQYLSFVGQLFDGNPLMTQKVTKNSRGFHTNDSVEGCVRHEVGHLIALQNGNSGTSATNGYQKASNERDYCKKIVAKALGKSTEGYDYLRFNENSLLLLSDSTISRYGKKNFNEAVAESWSNPNYSDFTKKVSNQMIEDLKKSKLSQNSISYDSEEESIPLCIGYGSEEEFLKEEK